MSDPTTTVDAYLSAYNEPDRDRRASSSKRPGPDGRLIDPPLTGEGHAEVGVAQTRGSIVLRWSSMRSKVLP
jgi:hypothetical protein